MVKPTCRHMDSILNSIQEGVFTVDVDRRITSFNRAAEIMTGFNRWEAIGSHCWEIIRNDACQSRCPFLRAMHSDRAVGDVRTTLATRHGTEIAVQISTGLLRDATGTVVGGVETVRDVEEMEHLRKELTGRYSLEDLVGKSPAMQNVFSLLPRIADSTSPVVVEGETGTGKELVARAIHALSSRREGPFVAVNCGALPDTLLESELFGHKAGAFTDARKDKPGRFQRAHGGTILLDEISDVSPAMQVRLLRVLQEGEVEPLGAVRPEPVDVRVIVAANRPLETLVSQGRFRRDLYYRIAVIRLTLPPLRERKEDIPLLADAIIAKVNSFQGKDVAGLSEDARACLMMHDYPGNVRELENIIEQAFVMRASGMIQVQDLPQDLCGNNRVPLPSGTLESLERSAIEHALRRAGGHRRHAAAELGIDPSTLYRKMKALGIPLPARDGRVRSVG